MTNDEKIKALIDEAAKVFIIDSDDIVKASHDRKVISLARKIIFVICADEKIDREDVKRYFNFSEMRYRYLFKSGKEMREEGNKNFTFNVKQIKIQTQLKTNKKRKVWLTE